MKPAVDEMFPEGAGPYVDLDEVRGCCGSCRRVPRPGGAVLAGHGPVTLSACFPRQGEVRGC